MAAGSRLNATGAKKKLKRWMRVIRQTSSTEAILAPTPVIRELSRRQGHTLLEDLSRSKVSKVEAEASGRTKRVIAKAKPGFLGQLGKEYRRWAYRYIEELLVDVRDGGAWGRVASNTARRKESTPANGGAGPGVPTTAYGVRATRPDWRAYQKSKKTGSGSRARDLPGKAELKVSHRGRRINS